MRLGKAFASQSRFWIFVEAIIVLLLIGLLDLVSGYQVRLLPFYAGPIFAAAWFCGKKHGIAAGLLGGVISLAADWVEGDPDLQGWSEGWEIVRHLSSCLAIALVGSALRSKRDIAAGRIALLEHSQRLEEEIVRITDSEQKRIGQDLHDGLCQYLAALACSAASLQDDLRKHHLQAESAAAAELAELLRDAVVQTRDLAHRLVPAHVARVGLPLALESLTQSVSRLHAINCTFQRRGHKEHFSDEQAKHLYRITQEAINNATKHGGARNILVTLDATTDLTRLSIDDDGIGFDSAAINGSSLGLQIMRYRARLSGSELEIEKSKQGGTRISCISRSKEDIPQDAIR